MASWILVNNVVVSTHQRYAGETINDTVEPLAPIQAAGGKLYDAATPGLSTAATLALAARARGAPLEDSESIMNAALDAQQQSRDQGGSSTLVGGTVTVATANITAASKILATRKTPGGTVGNLSVPSGSRVVGTPGSFAINSDSALETSTVDWFISG